MAIFQNIAPASRQCMSYLDLEIFSQPLSLFGAAGPSNLQQSTIMALKPLSYKDPLYQLLRDGKIKDFNQRKSQGKSRQLTSCDFRHLDLRGLDAAGRLE